MLAARCFVCDRRHYFLPTGIDLLLLPMMRLLKRCRVYLMALNHSRTS
jgi:hypothetical protein